MKTREKFRNLKGITLIGLVITIIIILILVATTVSIVIKEDGLLSQVSKSKILQEIARCGRKCQFCIL